MSAIEFEIEKITEDLEKLYKEVINRDYVTEDEVEKIDINK